MRRALLLCLAVAAASAACTVHLEGAACRVPGTTGDCPAGQACGTGSTCSLAATACTPCVAGAVECRAGSIDVMTCSAGSDPACGTWIVATACLAGLQACHAPTVGAPICVYLEGAACSVTGTTGGCPPGQACGTGRTCSVAAAGCTPCVNGTRTCQGGSTDVKSCSAAVDPACGTWTVATACLAGLQTCHAQPVGDPTCVYLEGVACSVPRATTGCPPGQTCGTGLTCVCDAWTVVPGGSAEACTRPSIAAAIAEAVKFPAGLVHLGGASPATYGNELDDAAPILIPAGVTLVGDDAMPASGTNRIIAVRGPGPEGLVVQPGAVVRGVAVQRGAAAANELTVGVLLPGGAAAGGAAAGGNTLVAVRIDAAGLGGAFGVGLRVAGGNVVAGANTIAVSDVLVKGATVAGLEVNRLGAGDVVIVTGSVFDSNHVGVSLLKGDLVLRATTVKSSGWEGVVAATGTPGQTSLALVDALISWNGRGGVRLSVNDKLSVTGTRVCGNAGYSRSPPGATRSVGGVFVVGDPPATLAFQGNVIHDNGGDQVLVGASGSSWNLTGATSSLCPVAARNVFAKYVAPGVGVAAVGASVVALFNSWGSAFPIVDRDFVGVTGGVNPGTELGATDFCGAALSADLTCPPP